MSEVQKKIWHIYIFFNQNYGGNNCTPKYHPMLHFFQTHGTYM